MPVSEKTRRALEDLGLTGYEAKAYTALLEYGHMTAAEISRNSQVPYSKIYEVLNTLEQKGWIEADHSRPSRFYPKSPSTALDTMRMRLESEWKRNQNQVLNELEPLYEGRGTRERPDIWIVRGEFNILSKVKEMLADCERELMIALPTALANLDEAFAPVLAALREKGVQVKVLTGADAPPEAVRGMGRWSEIRVREEMYGGGIISDARQVVLLLGEDSRRSQLAIWADHVGLAKFARDYFERLWEDSQVLAKTPTSR